MSPDERSKVLTKTVRTGNALFSALLPKDFYFNKGKVVIVKGVLVSGTITKEHIGAAHGSIIQRLWKDYGRDRTVDFLTDAPFVISRWLTEHGFSVGLQDCYPVDDSHQELLRQEIAKVKLAVEAMGAKLDDPLEEERREKQVVGYVNIAKSLGDRISTEKLTPNNALNIMTLSGAKGSISNIAQITGFLGQQFLRGQRMPLGISGRQRSLPYFEKGELDPVAQGLITHSFLSGMTPAELFFHQAAGREGLMDTAVKTSETGTIHHNFIKALEDIRVWSDGSVRNSVGTIFQMVYGEDGFDASELELVRTRFGETISFIDLRSSAGRINAKYGYYDTEATDKDKTSTVGKEEIKEIEFIQNDDPENDFDYDGGGE